MNTQKLHFIVIDDSKLDCFIAEKIINNTGRSAGVQTFQHVTKALEYIKALTSHPEKTIIFVDIQMPVLSGFDFVESFEQIPAEAKSHYVIYMLSSSINENDISKVRGYTSVKQFLNKPLTAKTMTMVLEDN
jgi:CheY-like chemotaxis protein